MSKELFQMKWINFMEFFLFTKKDSWNWNSFFSFDEFILRLDFFLISVSTVAHITLMMAKAKHVFMQGRFSTYIRSTRVSLRKKMYSLQPRLSTEREIVLDDVDFTTTGHYRCEVSGDAPMFQTASNEGILYVVGK